MLRLEFKKGSGIYNGDRIVKMRLTIVKERLLALAVVVLDIQFGVACCVLDLLTRSYNDGNNDDDVNERSPPRSTRTRSSAMMMIMKMM